MSNEPYSVCRFCKLTIFQQVVFYWYWANCGVCLWGNRNGYHNVVSDQNQTQRSAIRVFISIHVYLLKGVYVKGIWHTKRNYVWVQINVMIVHVIMLISVRFISFPTYCTKTVWLNAVKSWKPGSGKYITTKGCYLCIWSCRTVLWMALMVLRKRSTDMEHQIINASAVSFRFTLTHCLVDGVDLMTSI